MNRCNPSIFYTAETNERLNNATQGRNIRLLNTGLGIPNYSNGQIIISQSKSATYTVKENGWINYKIQARWEPVSVLVNNVAVGTTQITTDSYFVSLTGIAPVKKGDVVKVNTASTQEDAWVTVWFLSNR